MLDYKLNPVRFVMGKQGWESNSDCVLYITPAGLIFMLEFIMNSYNRAWREFNEWKKFVKSIIIIDKQ